MKLEMLVHVIDDDDAARQSLEFLLRTAQLQVRSHASAESFLEVLPTLRGGCIVTDIRMPGLSGIDLLWRLRELDVRVPVIVITGHGDVSLAVQAMKLGAVDFFEKPFDDELLLKAIHTALEHHERSSQHDAERSQLLARLGALSNRERQVLQGLVAGHPNKAIAFDLGISPRTVEIYRANLMAKMQASSLSELIRMALIGGILGTSDSEGDA
jgi:two-component system response regulator FixJ